MLRRFLTTMVLALVLLSAQGALAQEACEGAHYREFDFWVGEWDLTNLRLLDDGKWYDDDGAERVRLVPGDGDTITRVIGGNPINFVRR